MITFETIATPSLNVLFRGKWTELNWKKKYLRYLKAYKKHRLRSKQRMRIIYQRHGSRELDQENYFGSTKPLTDAIKELGLIIDDRYEWCEIVHLPQVKCKRGQEKITVRIEKEPLKASHFKEKDGDKVIINNTR